MTRAASRCLRLAAVAACTPARSPPISKSVPCSCPALPVPSRRLACWSPIVFAITRAVRWACRNWIQRSASWKKPPVPKTGGATLQRSADVRYAGQSYEINVPWLDTGGALVKTTQAFHAAHHKLYGYSDPARPIEIVTIRLRAVTTTNPPQLQVRRAGKSAEFTQRKIFVSGRWQQVDVTSRDAFGKTSRKGPLLIIDYGSTTLVLNDWTARVDRSGTLVLTH